VQKAYDQGDLPCCKGRNFDISKASSAAAQTTLCGRNAVQVTPPSGLRIDFASIADKIKERRPRRAEVQRVHAKAQITPTS